MLAADYSIIDRYPWLVRIACLLLGAITPLSFAPYNEWFTCLISIALFAALLNHASSGKQYFFLALTFGLGYFGTGVSWVYVSIYHFGSAPLPLAILLTVLFVSFVATFFALPFYALTWLKPSLRLLLGIPLLWVFSEWIRTWIFTGFPWLFVGYAHTDTLLSHWAPIGGVLLLSLYSVFSSCAVAAIFCRQLSLSRALLSLVCVVSIWSSSWILQAIEWTQAINDKISVGMVQPNIPQHLRWTPDYQQIIPERLHTLSEPLWGKDWIIWPEGALHNVYSLSLDFIEATQQQAAAHNSTVISGVIYDQPSNNDAERQQYFNSIISMGDDNDNNIYHKQRLVPFGEYVPLEDWIRGLITFFDLPFSVISSGTSAQPPLTLGTYSLANAICYEIAYPALVATQAHQAHVLLTVSNDAWFGHSIGPLQHFQMARMRAMEIGRYIIRGTNNGVSAIIAPDGSIQAQGEQYIETYIEGSVIPMTGTTPFMRWKNILVLSILGIMGLISIRRKTTRF
jgi:apolipoprotein N-acyltransferase